MAEQRVIVAYDIMSAERLHELNVGVNEAIGRGWQPHGPLVVEDTGSDTFFIQPLVKYKYPTS